MKRFLLLPLILPALLWTACGGKSNSNGTTNSVTVTVSPTTASVAAGTTQQFTASVTGSTNTAVTWQVAGTPGGDATHGTISSTGLYTAPITVPSTPQLNVTAVSQANSGSSATALVTITSPAVTVTVSPKTATVAAGRQQQFTATVTGGSTNTVTWSLRGCGTACGVIDPNTGLYTAPASPPQESITVVATSKDNSTFFDTAQVAVQFGNASLNGTYVFLLREPDNSTGSGFALRAGEFTADGNGNLTNGVEDLNSSAGGVVTKQQLSGTYSIGTDGRGSATIVDTASHAVSFVLTSTSRGQLIGFDSDVASGILRLQDSINNVAATTPSGPFVFELLGDSSGPAAAVGRVIFSGTTSTGLEDFNFGGSAAQSAISGSVTSPSSGRGTVGINGNYAYYIIDASTLVLIQTDNFGFRAAGIAYAQAGSFTTASLTSTAYLVSGTSSLKPYAQAGRFDADGSSKLSNGLFDINNGGNTTANSQFGSDAAYTLPSSSNGRGTLSTGTPTIGPSKSFIFWLASSTQGVILEVDPTSPGAVAVGLLFQQQTGISSLSGGFAFANGGASNDNTKAQSLDGELTLQGTSGIPSGTEDLNNAGLTNSAVALSGSVPPPANSRSSASLTGSGVTNGMPATIPYVFYFVSPNRFFMLSTSSVSVLSGVAERQCSDCQF